MITRKGFRDDCQAFISDFIRLENELFQAFSKAEELLDQIGSLQFVSLLFLGVLDTFLETCEALEVAISDFARRETLTHLVSKCDLADLPTCDLVGGQIETDQ